MKTRNFSLDISHFGIAILVIDSHFSWSVDGVPLEINRGIMKQIINERSGSLHVDTAGEISTYIDGGDVK